MKLLPFIIFIFFLGKSAFSQTSFNLKPDSLSIFNLSVGLENRINLHTNSSKLNINGAYLGYNFNSFIKFKLVYSTNFIQFRWIDTDFNERVHFFSIGEETTFLTIGKLNFSSNILIGYGNVFYLDNENKKPIIPLEMGLLMYYNFYAPWSIKFIAGNRQDLSREKLNGWFVSLGIRYSLRERKNK